MPATMYTCIQRRSPYPNAALEEWGSPRNVGQMKYPKRRRVMQTETNLMSVRLRILRPWTDEMRMVAATPTAAIQFAATQSLSPESQLTSAMAMKTDPQSQR